MADWKNNFKAYSLRTNFRLDLTRPQMEFLCAVTENVQWDRFQYGGNTAPHNFIASSRSLVIRGLIEEKKHQAKWSGKNIYEIESRWNLTPAGELLIELLKITGLFIESDNAIERKAAKKVVGIRKRR
jgi:hypothetical protein